MLTMLRIPTFFQLDSNLIPTRFLQDTGWKL
jgi:hypothetical protein